MAKLPGVENYVKYCLQHLEYKRSGNYRKGNRAFDRKLAALAKLREAPDRGEAALLELLDHHSDWVQVSAAVHLLPLREDIARPLLERYAAGPIGETQQNAYWVLHEWNRGRLKVP